MKIHPRARDGDVAALEGQQRLVPPRFQLRVRVDVALHRRLLRHVDARHPARRLDGAAIPREHGGLSGKREKQKQWSWHQ